MITKNRFRALPRKLVAMSRTAYLKDTGFAVPMEKNVVGLNAARVVVVVTNVVFMEKNAVEINAAKNQSVK